MRRLYLEKRKNRSTYFVEALKIYLGTVMQRAQIKALAVVDTDGLLVSEAHDDDTIEPEEVAAVCPLVVRVGGKCFSPGCKPGNVEEFSVMLFLFQDQPLYLVAVGDMENGCDLLCSTVEGVQRILGADC